MKAITLISIAPPIALEINVVRVAKDGPKGDRWLAEVEATYGGQPHAVKAEGATAEAAQTRALALAVKQALPKPVLEELLALD